MSPFHLDPSLAMESNSGMAKRALRDELGAGPVGRPTVWEDFARKLLPPGWEYWTERL